MAQLETNTFARDMAPVGRNNFDLIRLVAATQVAVTHVISYLDGGSDAIFVLKHFPGVPVFFFISGFLIYHSYQNIHQDRLRVFFRNRVLRLYPGLALCCAVTVVFVFASGYVTSDRFDYAALAAWLLAHLSIFQFYNPGFLRGFGTGAVNGSLWTISVELQFYLLTPVVCAVFRAGRKLSMAFILVFLLVNLWNTHFNAKASFIEQLVQYSFAPWFVMFLVGAYVAADRRVQRLFLSAHPLLLLAGYLMVSVISDLAGFGFGNEINILSFLLLAALIFSLAFRSPDYSTRLIGKNDISYGVYIFHMPIVNLFVYLGLKGQFLYLFMALGSTFIAAYCSWRLVERPALWFKRSALRRFQ